MPTIPKFTPTPDLAGDFEADMRNAQDLYDIYVRSGYSEQDADRMFMAPVRAKWELINKSPLLAQNPAKRKEFGAQFSAAQDRFRKDLGQYSRDTGQGAAESAFGPVFNRWAIEAQIPQPPAESEIPPMTVVDRNRISDLKSEIGRLNSQRERYRFDVQNAKLDAETRANYEKQIGLLNPAIDQLKSEYGSLLGKYDKPQVQASETPTMPIRVSTPFQSPAIPDIIAPQQPTGEFSAANWLNQPAPDMGQKIDRIFQPIAQPVMGQPKPDRKTGLIFISGRPDLSNVSREQADESWQAQYGVPLSRRTVFTPPVQETQDTLPDVEGLEPIKTAPQKGFISKGYKFLGGNPADQKNWEPVQ